MKRRSFVERVIGWAACLGLGGKAAAAAPAVRDNSSPGARPVGPFRVHWVSPDRRHIEAWLTHEGPSPVFAGDLVLQVRPPVLLSNGAISTYSMRVTGVPHGHFNADGRPQLNTWHYPEPEGAAAAAKPYAEWWYRAKPTDGHGPLTAKPDPWLIKQEGAEPAWFSAEAERRGMPCYRPDDSLSIEAQKAVWDRRHERTAARGPVLG